MAEVSDASRPPYPGGAPARLAPGSHVCDPSGVVSFHPLTGGLRYAATPG